ncbi:hypothetical protein [Pedobacter sp. GR22-6]|uniref:hypothetical protein n=1 Tax=Pedobacter sp. GR22-6 TaxID=3127957 RepID=UPI00307EF230
MNYSTYIPNIQKPPAYWPTSTGLLAEPQPEYKKPPKETKPYKRDDLLYKGIIESPQSVILSLSQNVNAIAIHPVQTQHDVMLLKR